MQNEIHLQNSEHISSYFTCTISVHISISLTELSCYCYTFGRVYSVYLESVFHLFFRVLFVHFESFFIQMILQVHVHTNFDWPNSNESMRRWLFQIFSLYMYSHILLIHFCALEHFFLFILALHSPFSFVPLYLFEEYFSSLLSLYVSVFSFFSLWFLAFSFQKSSGICQYHWSRIDYFSVFFL